MPLNKYGILAPVLGIREDFPSILIDDANISDGENVQLRWGEIHSAKMRNLLYDVAGSENILHYHLLVVSDGTHTLYAFTTDNIYELAGSSWTARGGLVTPCTEWSTVTWKDKIVATNNKDKVLIATQGFDFDELETDAGLEYSTGTFITKAKFVTAFENYLIVGNVTANTVEQPHRIYWADYGASDTPGDWKSGDAGSMIFEGGDHLQVARPHQGYLILFATNSTHRVWLTTQDWVFETAVFNRTIGTQAPESVVQDQNGEMFFFGNDYTFRELMRGIVSQKIDKTLKKQIDRKQNTKISGQLMEEYSEIWWSFAWTGETLPQTTNNRVVVMSAEGAFTYRAMDIQAFGRHIPDLGADHVWLSESAVTGTGTGDWASTPTNTLTDSTKDFVDAGILVDDFVVYSGVNYTITNVATTVLTCSTSPGGNPQNVNYTVSGYKVVPSIGATYATWLDWDWDEWTSAEAVEGFILDLGSDYVNKKTYALHTSRQDKGSAFTSFFTLETDLTERRSLNNFKRLLGLHLYFRGDSTDITVSIQLDNGSSFDTLATGLDASSNQDIVEKYLPCDYRAKNFGLKLSSTSAFKFIGVVFDYLLLGDR